MLQRRRDPRGDAGCAQYEGVKITVSQSLKLIGSVLSSGLSSPWSGSVLAVFRRVLARLGYRQRAFASRPRIGSIAPRCS